MFKARTAELVLVTPNGRLIGSLPAMPVATPWWQEVEPVVRAARDYHGVDVIILRLLDAELDQPSGGRVTYLAEIAEAVCAQPWTGSSTTNRGDTPMHDRAVRPPISLGHVRVWSSADFARRRRRRRCAHGIFRACGACRSKARPCG